MPKIPKKIKGGYTKDDENRSKYKKDISKIRKNIIELDCKQTIKQFDPDIFEERIKEASSLFNNAKFSIRKKFIFLKIYFYFLFVRIKN